MLDATEGKWRSSFMDVFSGYNQIKMDPSDGKKTAFQTPYGNFYYVVMLFGLKIAGSTYQRAMTYIFHDLLNQIVEVYVDDIVVKTQATEDHVSHLKTAFESCRKFKLKMNPLKCSFGMESGKFLGFVFGDRRSPGTRHGRGIAITYLLCQSSPKGRGVEISAGGASIPSLYRRNTETDTYLLTHETIVVAAANPITYLASKPVLAGRTARWLLQLSEFDLKYQRAKAVRGKAIADLMAMFPGEGHNEVHGYLPGEVAVADTDKKWTIFFDGSSYDTVGGDGVVFESPQGELLSYLFKLDFPCSNNVAKYGALILGLRMAKELNIGSVEVKGDSKIVTNQVNGDLYVKESHLAPYREEAQRLMNQTGSTVDHTGRGGNKHADALATLASKV
ncbi:uncharacterized protein LOC113291015 [Papaver somniferum]|uniref:uncharacterized protein LOC113291015 n=1 Tax=Papaver somniferum TaxID=3469 RepID=UPI000E7002A2|nr:uncharacterized protein LOC113291015 [Papaver somniferum]